MELTVFYASREGLAPYDPGYGRSISWDTDLIAGYRSVFLDAADRTPGLGDHLLDVRNWDVVPRILRGRFDIVWTAGYFSLTYVMAVLAQRLRGGPVFVREEQTLLDPRTLGNVVAKQVALRALLKGCYGLYISAENRRWLESFGMPPERLFFVPYVVDTELFRRQVEMFVPQREQLRAAFGIPSHTGPVILSVSRLIPKKQPLLLLEAFRRVRARIPCALLMVGSGPMEDEVRSRVVHDAIPDVYFSGFLNQSEVGRAYAVADVFTLLSGYQETFGMVVGEAMTFALPVVVSNRVGCAADLVSSDYNGFVVSDHDPAEIADRLERLVRAPRLRADMGAASRERISHWAVDRAADGLLAAAETAVPWFVR